MLWSIISWIVVGLIAGALADYVMKDISLGIGGKILLGLVGSFVGGFLFSLVGLGQNGLIGEVVVAFIGAIVAVWVYGLATKRHHSAV
jgi:uncharacterized membrane protein YeaQ/YmgE (transglycosylase-associated protein family)